jgi:pantoate--beta-alanine ligase
MVIIRTIKRLRQVLGQYRRKGEAVGFVPTMGALHSGHMSLIRAARRENDKVVVSIFVNPTQFGPAEDYQRYPRTFRQDALSCRREGVDIIFVPEAKEMFPAGYKTFVTVEDLSQLMCGRFRPGHFRGVATVVAKLFNIVQPDIAYFGQKDAQQAVVIRKMVDDLNLPIKMRVLPTMREKDGLAMSSRNTCLSAQERRDALVLFRALQLAKLLIQHGQKDAARIIQRMKELIRKKKSAKIDYAAIVDANTLVPLRKITAKCLIALAVRVGKTRLIDNILIP